MSDEDRQAMIESMVEGLAARLPRTRPTRRAGSGSPAPMRCWPPRDAQVALIGAADAAPGDLRLQLAALEQMVVAQLEAAFADAASRLLERTRNLAPEHPETLYFGGHFAKLNGDPRTARRLWGTLLERLPEDAPIVPQLRAAIESL